jgi:hypothetical protein
MRGEICLHIYVMTVSVVITKHKMTRLLVSNNLEMM